MHQPLPPNPEPRGFTRAQSAILALLFSATVTLPMIGLFAGWNGPALNELRNLAPRPDFRHARLADLPESIDAYLNDHVGFRGTMIRASGNLFHKIVLAPSSEVVIGKPAARDGNPWYFYASEGILDDRLGLSPLTAEQLDAWRTSLESRHAWLKRQGIRYLVVMVPDKSSVYPELLPDYMQSHLAPTRLDQLDQFLKDTGSEVSFLDLRPALLQAKPRGELYYPFDTHWNGRGMFYGYAAIAGALRSFFPDLSPGRLGPNLEIRDGPRSARTDLASMLGIAQDSPTPDLAYTGDSPARAPASWPQGADPAMNPNRGFYALETAGQRGRLLQFHDSFFAASLYSIESQPLAGHFARSYFAWLAPSDAAFQRFVELEHPDVVVEEHTERVIRFVPPPPAPLDAVTPGLPNSGVAAAFSIERINGRRTAPIDITIAGGEFNAEGWAIDRSAGRAAAGVEFAIDGVAHPAGYGIETPASQRSGCGGCTHSGFLADFAVADLAPGPHTLAIRVIAADRRSYAERPWGRIVIPNRGAR